MLIKQLLMKTGNILGAHIFLGPEAGEVVNMFSMSMAGKMTMENLELARIRNPANSMAFND